jgi:tRNA nucleotidyltransferase (CCA-adding enzyme)
MKIYLVGGAVRDSMLGRTGSDRDYVVVGATVDEMLAQGYRPVGKDFPVFLHPKTGAEYALARTERKSGKGYKGFTVYAAPDVTLEEDLQRRDLSINAMAVPASDSSDCVDTTALIDPWGGARDLAARKLRHVSPAFREDPLRVLRVARFAARFADLGFSVDESTMALMREITDSGELEHLVAERSWREIDTALGERRAPVFFEVLRECGALAVLLPELEKLFGVPQRAEYHPEVDTGVHSLMVLEQACKISDDKSVRFAALIHDLGKGTTDPELWPRHIGHESRGVSIIAKLCERLRTPSDYQNLAQLASEYHTHCHRALELRPVTLLKLFESVDAFRRPERLEKFLQVCEADARGRLGYEEKPYPQADYLRCAFATVTDIRVPDLLKDNPVPKDAASGEFIKALLHKTRQQKLSAFVSQYRASMGLRDEPGY